MEYPTQIYTAIYTHTHVLGVYVCVCVILRNYKPIWKNGSDFYMTLAAFCIKRHTVLSSAKTRNNRQAGRSFYRTSIPQIQSRVL